MGCGDKEAGVCVGSGSGINGEDAASSVSGKGGCRGGGGGGGGGGESGGGGGGGGCGLAASLPAGGLLTSRSNALGSCDSHGDNRLKVFASVDNSDDVEYDDVPFIGSCDLLPAL